MRVVVCSDLHGRSEYLDALVAMYPLADGFVFLGDGVRDFEYFPQTPPQFFISVAGNCDGFSSSPAVLVQSFEAVKAYITHGHIHGVKSSLSGILSAAVRAGCRLVLYGHTHKARIDVENGVTLVCPGALKNGEYALLEINGDKIRAELKTL